MQELCGGRTVDLATFTQLANKIDTPSHEEVLEAFSVFDTAGQGYIALGELKHLMKALGEGLSDNELKGLEAAAGADAENQVNVRHLVYVNLYNTDSISTYAHIL